MSQDANALIMGNSVPSASFLELGALHEGTITALSTMQQRDMKTGEPKFWKNGDPMMQAVVTLKTEERDPEIENDNGMRRLFVSSKGMKDAIAAAVKKAGADGLAVGGTLGVKYLRDGEAQTKGFNPPKIYGAKYEAPPPGQDDYEEAPEGFAEYSDDPF